uniref:Uncharacterized protein n=1 Tax=Rangifer tarandus platyrhynchus TaxID=3082113 RepID=A0ACB0FN07_RANTA|nr:unnamed protein product [Rangifer tarandus platyrhynchus]
MAAERRAARSCSSAYRKGDWRRQPLAAQPRDDLLSAAAWAPGMHVQCAFHTVPILETRRTQDAGADESKRGEEGTHPPTDRSSPFLAKHLPFTSTQDDCFRTQSSYNIYKTREEKAKCLHIYNLQCVISRTQESGSLSMNTPAPRKKGLALAGWHLLESEFRARVPQSTVAFLGVREKGRKQSSPSTPSCQLKSCLRRLALLRTRRRAGLRSPVLRLKSDEKSRM